MSVALICCRMLENELNKILTDENISAPVYWIDAGLHNAPEKLHDEIQNLLDKMPSDVNRVILLYSLCGQSVIGLKTHNYDLIMPRTDDCIALLLGGNSKKVDLIGTYFLTDRWLDDEKSLMNEYKYAYEKYGEKRCERIFKRQFAHYNVLGLLDTGAYEVNSLIEKTNQIAKVLELTPKIIHTDCEMLRTLVNLAKSDSSPIPDSLQSDYLRVKNNSEIIYEMFN